MGRAAVSLSPTIDEPFHLVRGLAYWQERDARLSYNHPPLVNALTGIVAGPFGKDALASLPGWRLHDSSKTATQFLKKDYPHARRLIVVGRFVNVALTALFLFYLFALVRRHRGDGVALVALVLVASNPTVLAHGSLLTNDLGATAFFVLLLGQSLRYLQHDGRLPALTAFLSLGLAAVAKYNLLPFVAIFPVVTFAVAYRGWGRFTNATRRLRLRKAAIEVAMAVGVAWLVVNSTYFFEHSVWTRNGLASDPTLSGSHLVERLERGKFGRIAGWVPFPLPATYCAGLNTVGHHVEGGHLSWFMGTVREKGTPLYFPTLLIIKTPILYGVLLLVGGLIWWRQRRSLDPLLLTFGGAALFYLPFLLFAGVNIGVRHALPIVPCVAIAAGYGAVALWERLVSRGARVSLALVVMGALAIPALNFPDYLGYFNLLVGRQRGHAISIVGEDWGQNTIDLARDWQGKSSVLYYDPYPMGGMDELLLSGVSAKRLDCKAEPEPPGFVAVHAADWLRQPKCYPWRTRARLVRTYQEHILLFELQAPR